MAEQYKLLLRKNFLQFLENMISIIIKTVNYKNKRKSDFNTGSEFSEIFLLLLMHNDHQGTEREHQWGVCEHNIWA